MDPRPKPLGEERPIVLCVEDEPDLLEDIGAELVAAGYDARLAADGLEALDQLETYRPDVVLCDIMLPRLGGHEFLRTLRTRRPDLADVPFIFLTALDRREEIISGKLAGADDYLVKPVDFDLMLASIQARLQQVSRMREKTARELAKGLSAAPPLPEGGTTFGSAAERALNLIAVGIIILDQDGCILFANAAARHVSAQEGALTLGRKIEPQAQADAKSLRVALAEAAMASVAGREFLTGLSLGHAAGTSNLLALVSSLPGTQPVTRQVPASVVFLTDPARRPRLSQRLIREFFGLTPAEAQIALELAEGHRREQIAERLGISPTTVAFHMRNLFQKTGTNRQADLVAMILGGLGPIAPEGSGIGAVSRSWR